MKPFSHSIWLQVGFLAAGPLFAAALPSMADFNVIFPRNNTAYKPMHPFPVVFGVRNLESVGHSTFNWEWSIASSDSPSEVLASDSVSSGGPSNPKEPTGEVSLYTVPVRELQNATANTFIFTAGFGIYDTCDSEGKATNLSVSFNKTLYFTFDKEGGEEPDLLTGEPCATSVGAIGIREEIPLDDPIRKKCLVLETSPQTIDKCLKVDTDLANYVATQFTRAPAKCEEQSWPNVSFLRGKCDPQSSGSGQASISMGDLLPVLFSVGALFLSM